MKNNINTYVEGVGRALDESEIKSLKTTSVKTANAISKALSDSGIHYLYSVDEIEIFRRAEQLIDRRTCALEKAIRLKVKANKERERARMKVKDDLNDRLFGGSKSDDEIIIIARALAEYTKSMALGFSFAPTQLSPTDIERNISNIRQLKWHIVNELSRDYEAHHFNSSYHGNFSWDAFDALCDQRLAEAAYVPHLSSDDDADGFSL